MTGKKQGLQFYGNSNWGQITSWVLGGLGLGQSDLEVFCSEFEDLCLIVVSCVFQEKVGIELGKPAEFKKRR